MRGMIARPVRSRLHVVNLASNADADGTRCIPVLTSGQRVVQWLRFPTRRAPCTQPWMTRGPTPALSALQAFRFLSESNYTYDRVQILTSTSKDTHVYAHLNILNRV